MKILCIIHANFETSGVIADWARKRDHSFSVIRPYTGEDCPNIQGYDFLIVMGGPQSPLELKKCPYLKSEIELIQQALAQNKTILGFCLGAQLIGEALGTNTERSPEKEVGIFPVELTAEAANDPLFVGLPSKLPVIHWHNDMPGLTKDSILLASSKGCPRQVVRYRNRVYGFQCHLEITQEGIKTMVEACPGDLKPSRFTQSKAELLEQDYTGINKVMLTILDRLVAI